MNILTEDLAKNYQSSSLNRGHVVFTSFVAKNGKILFFDSHLKRLLMGADFLFPNLGWPLNHKKIKQYVEEVASTLSLASPVNNQYLRLTIFDDNIHLQHKAFEEPTSKIALMSAVKIRTPDLIPPYLKISSYVESDLELIRARFKKFDDVVFFDVDHNVTEASSSNIFVVTKENAILTPPTSSMVLDGVLRKKLLEFFAKENFSCLETIISKSELQNAREVWLTNSVKGIRYVEHFEDHYYLDEPKTYQKIIKTFGRYGELL